MSLHFQPEDQPELEPFSAFRVRVVGLLDTADPTREELERALTDAVARRMLSATGPRRISIRSVPAAQKAAELDRLIVDLRAALDGSIA